MSEGYDRLNASLDRCIEAAKKLDAQTKNMAQSYKDELDLHDKNIADHLQNSFNTTESELNNLERGVRDWRHEIHMQHQSIRTTIVSCSLASIIVIFLVFVWGMIIANFLSISQ